MIIHAGGISTRGKKNEVLDFLHWYDTLDFTYKIFIAGNHDFFFENESSEEIKAILPENIIYLNDSGIKIDGLKIWESPYKPGFMIGRLTTNEALKSKNTGISSLIIWIFS